MHAIAESGEFEYFHAIVTGLARLNIRVTLASLYMAPFVIDMSSRLRGVIVLAAQESAKVQQIANKSDEVTPAYEIAEIGIVAELFPSPDDLQILEYVTLVAPHTSVVWKSDRGWKLSARRAEPGVIIGPVCELAREGINLTEEDDEPTLLYLECISRVFEQAGVHVDPASLYRAPYRFSIGGRMQRVLSDEVDDMLTQYEIAKLWCKDGFDFTEQLLDTEYLHLR
ncbi:hypothetical protein [Candidatus Poriferisodalis sp.]|uniref:hypothetical protein n=1 Tax=Candidatus Poriferisodalis sp. TaxID=3101277 RepID=UPI003B019227